ncbi:glycosyltransferase family 2 protein [Marinibaculum pumilum]|uniref:Glycosyltransferase family 2 protein n=1 Tax=Marinibaculum pumilum TaxID=1766165 RepID=A0ABV7KYE2_9PROT
MPDFTLIVPYYRNPQMLARQVEEWEKYPPGIRIMVVDDCSPEPAADVIGERRRVDIYRILDDIPWNRNGARNLGAKMALTEWIMHVDIDHVLPAESAARLRAKRLDSDRWYRFARYRVGAADETRRKDDLPDDCEFGPVKPHVDSYICPQWLYWTVGGYDEAYSGSLGGSAPFLSLMTKAAPVDVLADVPLHVHTRHSVPDASDTTLSRDRSRYDAIKAAQGVRKAVNPIRFRWQQVG